MDISSPLSHHGVGANVATPGASLKEKYDTVWQRIHTNGDVLEKKAATADHLLTLSQNRIQAKEHQWIAINNEVAPLGQVKAKINECHSQIHKILNMLREAEYMLVELEQHSRDEAYKRWKYNELQGVEKHRAMNLEKLEKEEKRLQREREAREKAARMNPSPPTVPISSVSEIPAPTHKGRLPPTPPVQPLTAPVEEPAPQEETVEAAPEVVEEEENVVEESVVEESTPVAEEKQIEETEETQEPVEEEAAVEAEEHEEAVEVSEVTEPQSNVEEGEADESDEEGDM